MPSVMYLYTSRALQSRLPGRSTRSLHSPRVSSPTQLTQNGRPTVTAATGIAISFSRRNETTSRRDRLGNLGAQCQRSSRQTNVIPEKLDAVWHRRGASTETHKLVRESTLCVARSRQRQRSSPGGGVVSSPASCSADGAKQPTPTVSRRVWRQQLITGTTDSSVKKLRMPSCIRPFV